MIYSKRHIKGLPSPKEIVVKSLSDYMKLFSSDKFSNYIYRGEPTNYHSTISSVLRGKGCNNGSKGKECDRLLSLNRRQAKKLRWHVILYLNLLESILVSWQYSVADREIIEQELPFLL